MLVGLCDRLVRSCRRLVGLFRGLAEVVGRNSLACLRWSSAFVLERGVLIYVLVFLDAWHLHLR